MSFKRRFMIDGFELPQQLVAFSGQLDDEAEGGVRTSSKPSLNDLSYII